MRLLIVEDEEDVAIELKKILELKGFAVDWLKDGDNAQSRIIMYQNEYDLIILDLTLIGMNGLTLTKNIRSEGVTTPIIVLTADSQTKRKVELLNAGADDYLIKPFSPIELIARITSVLRRPPMSQQVVHAVGDISINTSTHRVLLRDTEVFLTLKEYALLEYLVKNTGKVRSRQEIAEAVWGLNFETGTNFIDVYINYLRNKIDKRFTPKLIHTVTGFGYVLKLPD